MRTFFVMEYHRGRWTQQPVRRFPATSYEDAARQAAGDGLTLIGRSRIRGLDYLVAKVWDGNAFHYAYRYPTSAPAA